VAKDPRAISAKDVEAVSFSTALHGYDLELADELFDRITETLARYESGLELRPGHLTAQQVVESELPISTPGYEANEINGFIDWIVWTLRRYESGHQPDRALLAGQNRSAPAVANEPAETALAAKPPAKLDDTEPSVVESPEQSEESLPQHRPLSSEELLEQAKKWRDR
jgi:hypothetical protein